MVGVLLAGCGGEAERPGPVEPDVTLPLSPRPIERRVTVTAVEVAAHTLENGRRVAVTLSSESPAALLCVDSADPDERHLLESPPAVDHLFPLQGLRYDATYTCATAPTPETRSVWSFPITVGPAPSWAPAFTVTTHPSHPAPEGYLLTGMQDTGGCSSVLHLAIFDTAGGLRWHFPILGTEMGVEVLHVGGGVIVYGGSTNAPGPAAVHVWDGELWSSDLPGEASLHHDAKQLVDGRVLTLERRTNTLGDATWTGFGARTFDPLTGVVDFEYSSQRAVDAGDLQAGVGDAWHANWADLLDHGDGPTLYVSLCFAYQVVAIDAVTGDVRWIFGPGGDFRLIDPQGLPLDDTEFTQCQHGLEVSDDGTRLLAYDNGRGRDESRAVEYLLDPVGGVATRLWTWSDGWREPTLGDIDWLPNGNVLVTQGHADCWSNGDRSEIVEVDPTTGEEWWRLAFDDEDDAIYRSERLDGCEVFTNVGLCAGLEARWSELAPSFGL